MKIVINLILFFAVCSVHGYGQQRDLVDRENASIIKHWWNTSNNQELFPIEKANPTPPSISNENSRSAQNPNEKKTNPQSILNEKTKKSISLEKIAYNTSRKFDLITWIKEEKLELGKKQSIDIQFNLKAVNLKALEKSPFTIEFELDKDKQKEFNSFQIDFEYVDKENLKIRFTINPLNIDDDKVQMNQNISTKKVMEDGSLQITLTTTLSKQAPYFTNLIRTEHKEDSDSIPLSNIQITNNKKIKGINLNQTKIKSIRLKYEGVEKSMPDISILAIEDNSIYDAQAFKKTNPTRKAIIIANYNYLQEDEFPSLGTHPREDALGVKAILEKEDNLYRWETDTLFNLSKNDLRKILLDGAYTRGFDTLFVYYAGHGLSNNQESEYQDYWVPDSVNLDKKVLEKAVDKKREILKELDDKFSNKKIYQTQYHQSLDSIYKKYNEISIEFYNKNLYNIKDVLKDLYTAALHENNNDVEGTNQKLKILMISDACREVVDDKRGGKIKRRNNDNDSIFEFDYWIWPVVEIGNKTPNEHSWTQRYFIKAQEDEKYYNNYSFGSIPHLEYVKPIINQRVGKDKMVKNPINEIKLLKSKNIN